MLVSELDLARVLFAKVQAALPRDSATDASVDMVQNMVMGHRKDTSHFVVSYDAVVNSKVATALEKVDACVWQLHAR